MTIPAVSLRKVALLVASLDTETADRLLDQFGEQADAVRRILMELDDIDPQEQQSAIDDFLAHADAPAPSRGPRRMSEAHQVARRQVGRENADRESGVELSASLAERLGLAQDAGASFGELHAPDPAHGDDPSGDGELAPFRFLRRRSSAEMAAILAEEHPQTVALVLTHAADDVVPGVLAALPARMQPEVLRRLVEFEDAHPEILKEVERGLQSRMSQQSLRDARRQERLTHLRAILAAAAPSLRDGLLDNLERHDPDFAASIRPRTRQPRFEELLEQGDQLVMRAFTAVEPAVRMIALAGAPTALLERIARQLPPEEARALRKALLNMGPLRLSDVDAAQREVAQKAAELESENFAPPRSAALAA